MAKYYMINKPAGCITAKRDVVHPVIMEYFKDINNDNLNPVGRLDIDTEGLLFVTDDGKWNNRLMSPEFHVPKTYFFWALGEFNEEKIKSFEKGVIMRGTDTPTKPAKAQVDKVIELRELPEYAKASRFTSIKYNTPETSVSSGYITITEGKKRQIKRMLKAVGCYCIYLKRVKIGDVELDNNLAPGEFRELTEEELKKL